MKTFVVTEGNYSSYRIRAVFETKADAERAVAQGFGTRVEEYTVVKAGDLRLYRWYNCTIVKDSMKMPKDPMVARHKADDGIFGGYELELVERKLKTRESKHKFAIEGSNLDQVKAERAKILISLGRTP